jgi:putative alpha-1,2-mannosidase
MMGLYPVTPGLPIYDLASPVFDRVTIKLHNGKTFTIVCRNNSANNKYIHAIKLDGRDQTKVWIKHADVVAGGKLELQMGDTPNRTLGNKPEDFPPSALSQNPTP